MNENNTCSEIKVHKKRGRKPKHLKMGTDTNTIHSRIQIFLDLLRKNSLFNDVWITEDDPEKITSKIESLGLIEPQLIRGNKIYKPSMNEAALLSFYQNNISHFFLIYSLICLALKYVRYLSIDELFRLVNLVYPFLESDAHLSWDKIQINDVTKESLSLLVQLDLIQKNKSSILKKPQERGQNFQDYLALSNLCESSIKRFYIVMNTLWAKEKIAIYELQNSCISIANNLQKREGWLYSEFSDPTKFKIFIDKLIEDKYVKEHPYQKLSAARITKKVQVEFERFFNPEFMREVSQFNSGL